MTDVQEGYEQVDLPEDFNEFPLNMTDEEFRDYFDQCREAEFTAQDNAESSNIRFVCCGEEMRIGHDSTMFCTKCNGTKSFVGDLDIDHSAAEIPRIHVFGKNASLHRRRVFGYSNSNYNYARSRERTLTIMLDRMQARSRELKFSKAILRCALEICLKVTATRIYRKDILLEIIAASLSEACVSHGQMRRDGEIANYVGLRMAGFAQAKKALRILALNGELELPKCPEDPVVLTARDFLLRIKVDLLYEPLIVTVVNKVMDDTLTNALLPSICAAAIWILLRATSDTIPEHSKISIVNLDKAYAVRQMTIITTSTEIMKYWSRIKEIFEEYKVTLPRDLPMRIPRVSKKSTRAITVRENEQVSPGR